MYLPWFSICVCSRLRIIRMLCVQRYVYMCWFSTQTAVKFDNWETFFWFRVFFSCFFWNDDPISDLGNQCDLCVLTGAQYLKYQSVFVCVINIIWFLYKKKHIDFERKKMLRCFCLLNIELIKCFCLCDSVSLLK